MTLILLLITEKLNWFQMLFNNTYYDVVVFNEFIAGIIHEFAAASIKQDQHFTNL